MCRMLVAGSLSLFAACAAESGESEGVAASGPESAGVAGGGASEPTERSRVPEPFVSSVSAPEPVSALPGDDWQTLCGEIGTWTEDVLTRAPEGTCLLGGLVLGANPQMCESMVDSCLQTADATAAPSCDPGLQSACTATIGEIESCLNQVGTVIGSLGSDVSCATTLDRTMLGAVLRPLTGATTCLALQATCPALAQAVMPGTMGN